MSLLVTNHYREIKYYNFSSGQLMDPKDALDSIQIRPEDLDAAKNGSTFAIQRPGIYNAIGGLAPIPPRTSWSISRNTFSFESAININLRLVTANLQSLERVTRKYISTFGGSGLAVEISGGLDTSIIIGFLRSLGVNPALIGFTSNKYEFRTEKVIQEIYLKGAKSSSIIDYDTECHAFSNLSKAPVHPYPTAASLFYARHAQVIERAKKLGVKYVLNGGAGDNVLGHSFKNLAPSLLPGQYRYWSLSDEWSDQTIYKPQGLRYISAFALFPFPELIAKLRENEGEDPMKMWAREYFSSYIPTELQKYAYKAAHDGWIATGLKLAIDEIAIIAKTTYAIVKRDELRPELMVDGAKNFFHMDENIRHDYLNILSFAVWCHALVREGYV